METENFRTGWRLKSCLLQQRSPGHASILPSVGLAEQLLISAPISSLKIIARKLRHLQFRNTLLKADLKSSF